MGPRYSWTLSLQHIFETLPTLVDDDNNSILTDDVYRAIPRKLSELSQPFSTFPKKIVLISQLEVNEIFTRYGLNSLGPLVLWQCLKHIWNMHKSLYNLNSEMVGAWGMQQYAEQLECSKTHGRDNKAKLNGGATREVLIFQSHKMSLKYLWSGWLQNLLFRVRLSVDKAPRLTVSE